MVRAGCSRALSTHPPAHLARHRQRSDHHAHRRRRQAMVVHRALPTSSGPSAWPRLLPCMIRPTVSAAWAGVDLTCGTDDSRLASTRPPMAENTSGGCGRSVAVCAAPAGGHCCARTGPWPGCQGQAQGKVSAARANAHRRCPRPCPCGCLQASFRRSRRRVSAHRSPHRPRSRRLRPRIRTGAGTPIGSLRNPWSRAGSP